MELSLIWTMKNVLSGRVTCKLLCHQMG